MRAGPTTTRKRAARRRWGWRWGRAEGGKDGTSTLAPPASGRGRFLSSPSTFRPSVLPSIYHPLPPRGAAHAPPPAPGRRRRFSAGRLDRPAARPGALSRSESGDREDPRCGARAARGPLSRPYPAPHRRAGRASPDFRGRGTRAPARRGATQPADQLALEDAGVHRLDSGAHRGGGAGAEGAGAPAVGGARGRGPAPARPPPPPARPPARKKAGVHLLDRGADRS